MSKVADDTDSHMEGTSPAMVTEDPIAALGSDMVSPPASQPAPNTANSHATRSHNSDSAQNEVKTHAPSGYTYKRDEDAPGWSWKNKRVKDEMQKAARDVDAPNVVVGMRFGDTALVADPSTPWDKLI